ncbi:type II toxin-antitoxin system Phd/YefM family antitoxin [Microbacterium sp. NPDC087591]|jgi:prevent-host-death family protein|uniref:type II toxin-antitoxin system Phd/YefM family antitoxin n=1 Tax=Microbacterium sp. NPDC087591 TaxID=3364192 RepID=UPI003826572E
MQSVPLSEAKDRLSRLVDQVEREHETIEITRHGRGAAVLVSKDALDSLYETLFWLSQSGTREDVDAARLQTAAGGLRSAEDTISRYGVRPR